LSRFRPERSLDGGDGYVIQSIGIVVWLNILLVLGATYGRRWTVYVLAGVSLVSGVAQGATLEPRRFIISAIELGAAAACIAYLAQTRSDQTQARSSFSASRSIPTSTARSVPVLLAVDQQLGEGARLRVPQNSPIRSGRSKSGIIRTWSSSVRGAGPEGRAHAG
jgi:hypothetical protein